ncbi:hypothetical protein H7849_19440 [Alloacidobacterium dinghuense]|uniref:Uncharacterized protein n=1 Tax=Alloacidobacterium dinghuense TaxID=2763107 RepID=A0A7G8BFC4_9BACT|nr:hypothetical protein [Alloacidobacterium dinghuense]QNI31244.1 hypothetical protein H7849_19440 [Alloacidobacterium dinghuense]
MYHNPPEKADMLREERNQSTVSLSDSLTQFPGHDGDKNCSKLTFFEHYHCGKLAIHIHLSILRNGERANLCLEMHRFWQVFSHCEEFPVFIEEGRGIAWSRASRQDGYMQFPVLVSVCEVSESHQSRWHKVSPTLVRLQSLNDCDCLKRNAPERITTDFLVKRTTASGDGKLMMRFGFLAWVVPSEKFANKIVETGIGGLKNISEHMGYDRGRVAANCGFEVSPSFSLRLVITLGKEPNVLWIDVFGDGFIEDVEMMACPL